MTPQEVLKVATPMAYEQLFVAGFAPQIDQLLGGRSEPSDAPCEWSVRLLTGIFPDMSGKICRHRKRFYCALFTDSAGHVQHGVAGHNRFGRMIQWGHFKADVGWGRDGRPCLVLDYGLSCNSFLTDHVKDYLRTTSDPNLLIGKFYVGDWFGGYFTLTRISRA